MSIEIKGRRALALDYSMAHEQLRLAMHERILALDPSADLDLGYIELFTMKSKQKKGRPS